MTQDDRLDWFPCNPAKLLGALGGMKANEGYVYVVVLLRIYEVGGPCRDSLDALAIRTRLNKRVVSDHLDSLFRAGRLVRRENGIHNPVAETVLASSRALRAERKRAGQEGGIRSARKRQVNQSNGATKASILLEQNPTQLQLQEQEQVGSKKVNKGVRAVARPLPEDWALSEKGFGYAAEHGFDRSAAVLLSAAFKDHHRNRGTKGLDWEAGWRMWVRNEIKFNGNRRGGSNGKT